MTDDFDADFGVDEWHGTNAFIRDADRVFRTYFVNNRGDEVLGNTCSHLDMTALGRQEDWEDSPKGYPQTRAYQWWHWHDDYGNEHPVCRLAEKHPGENDQIRTRRPRRRFRRPSSTPRRWRWRASLPKGPGTPCGGARFCE
jgi:hypothetical protein